MSDVTIVAQTQRIEVSPTPETIVISQENIDVTVSQPSTSVTVVNAGPPGPTGQNGLSGDYDASLLLDEVDTRIATHNQASPVHTQATSGRDFVALFQNGLI